MVHITRGLARSPKTSSTVGEILAKADGHSVGQDLGASDPRHRVAGGSVIPLWEKLVAALRHLIETQELPLNRNGAAGWRIGDDLWLVSKRTVDALRLHLLQTGHTGIPTQNDRLFDVLQEHRVLVPNGDRAIWRAEVRGPGFAHTLTLIRIPASRLWSDAGGWPACFEGEIVLPDAVADEPASSRESELPAEAEVLLPVEQERPPAPANPSIAKPNTTTFRPSETPTSHKPTIPDNPFLTWLTAGLRQKAIANNHPGARVHVVAEGVLLISPGVFMDYVAATPDCKEGWEKVQKRFLKLGLHERTDEDLNMHAYRVAGSHRESVIKGIRIKDPTTIFGDRIPLPNPHLVVSEAA